MLALCLPSARKAILPAPYADANNLVIDLAQRSLDVAAAVNPAGRLPFVADQHTKPASPNSRITSQW